MIDLTKIKKFPVMGFTESNRVYFIHDCVISDKNRLYECSKTSSKPSSDMSVFRHFVNSHGELTCPEGRSITTCDGSLSIVGLLVPLEELLETTEKLEETQKVLEDIKYSREVLNNELDKAIKLHNALYADKTKLLKELEFTKNELREAIKQRNGFSAIHGETIKEHQETQKELRETKQKRNGLIKQLEESKKQNDYFSEQLTKVNNELNERDKSFSILLNQKRNALFEIDKLKKGTMFKLEQDNIVLYNELNRTKRLLERETNDYKTKEEQLKKLEDSYNSLYRELEATRQELGQLKIEYTLTCRKCTSTLGEQIQKEVDLNNLVTHLKSAIEVLSNELGETKKKLEVTEFPSDRFRFIKELEANKKLLSRYAEELKETKKKLEEKLDPDYLCKQAMLTLEKRLVEESEIFKKKLESPWGLKLFRSQLEENIREIKEIDREREKYKDEDFKNKLTKLLRTNQLLIKTIDSYPTNPMIS
jgi:myosin heavy subunit